MEKITLDMTTADARQVLADAMQRSEETFQRTVAADTARMAAYGAVAGYWRSRFSDEDNIFSYEELCDRDSMARCIASELEAAVRAGDEERIENRREALLDYVDLYIDDAIERVDALIAATRAYEEAHMAWLRNSQAALDICQRIQELVRPN